MQLYRADHSRVNPKLFSIPLMLCPDFLGLLLHITFGEALPFVLLPHQRAGPVSSSLSIATAVILHNQWPHAAQKADKSFTGFYFISRQEGKNLTVLPGALVSV